MGATHKKQETRDDSVHELALADAMSKKEA